MRTCSDFEAILTELKEKNMTEEQYYRTFILNKYIEQGLDYDLYSISNVTLLESGSTFMLKNPIEDGINVYISLKGNYKRYTDKKDRAYVEINVDLKTITLYFRVFDEWHTVEQVELYTEDEDERARQEENFATLNELVYKDGLGSQYENLREKYFTSVVVDSMLVDGDVYNVFTRKALVKVLLNPTGPMIDVLAESLLEYSTQDKKWIKDNLTQIEENGIISLLESAIKTGELELEGVPKPTPRPNSTNRESKFMKKERQVVEENPDVSIAKTEHNKLADAGFVIGEDKKESPKTKIPKKREEVIEEESTKEEIKEGVERTSDGSVDLGSMLD